MANISVPPVFGYDQPDNNPLSAEQLKEEPTGSLAAEIMAEMFRRMARKLVQAVDDDPEMLLPRIADGSNTGVSEWFAVYQDHLFTIIMQLFQEEAPDIIRFRGRRRAGIPHQELLAFRQL